MILKENSHNSPPFEIYFFKLINLDCIIESSLVIWMKAKGSIDTILSFPWLYEYLNLDRNKWKIGGFNFGEFFFMSLHAMNSMWAPLWGMISFNSLTCLFFFYDKIERWAPCGWKVTHSKGHIRITLYSWQAVMWVMLKGSS